MVERNGWGERKTLTRKLPCGSGQAKKKNKEDTRPICKLPFVCACCAPSRTVAIFAGHLVLVIARAARGALAAARAREPHLLSPPRALQSTKP